MPIDSTFDNSNAHINLIEDGSPKTSSNPQKDTLFIEAKKSGYEGGQKLEEFEESKE